MVMEILQCHDDGGAPDRDVMARNGGGQSDAGSTASSLAANALCFSHSRDCSPAISGRGCAERDGAADVKAGDLVRVREAVWRVMEVRAFARTVTRTRVLRLVGADAMNRWQPCTLLEPFDQPRRVEAVTAPRVISRARWMRTCAALIAASPPPECPATIADAQVTLMPHQIDPVLAVLRGRASRLLLADAVGLGKTIQAALLLRELRARGCADRVLILTPSGLRDQWRQELSHRAGLRADVIDAATLAARRRELPPDVNPWSLPGIVIVSLDFIKQPSVLHGAGAIVRDVLIVDEAHNLNEGTDRLAAANLLARHSRHVVLLTATPHHGSDDAFNTLCRVGQITASAIAVDGDPIVIFRRTRETLGLARTRKVHVLRVAPTKQERHLHTLLSRYVGRVERERISEHESERGHGPDVGDARSVIAGDTVQGAQRRADAVSLAMSVLLKRASSSAASLERSLRRRLALLDESAPLTPDDAPPQPRLPFTDETDDDLADGEPAHVLGAPGLRSRRVERAWLTLLIEASRNAARAESKPRALARLLRRCREPALIYTEYRDTLTHLARTLGDKSRQGADVSNTSSYALLHGGLGADARRAALARFTSGETRILLTTDAAAEGLNLHHRCRLVINVELPWNPNRLEQRIGRVDRLGQRRTVHAIHLVAATAEEQMLTRLTGRVERIAATLGDGPAVLRVPCDAGVDADDVTRSDVVWDGVMRDGVASDGIARDDVMRDGSTRDGASRDDVIRDDDTQDGDRTGACRSVSATAVEVAAQLQSMRAMRSRAWRSCGRRRHIDGAHAHAIAEALVRSRGDPLLALDERAPLIAVTRRRLPRQSQTSPLDGPGLLCLWRTRVHRDDGHADRRARASPSVLTVTHIGCEVPRFSDRAAIASFVTTTIERCRGRVEPLLDRELAAARDHLDAADRARIERLARRDAASAAALAATLRARASGNGWLQPLLFEDIASEKTTMAVASTERGYSLMRDGNGRLGTSKSIDTPSDAGELMNPSLAMVLVLC